MKHFPDIQLTFAETRVLGCLLEKEVLTPDVYPLSLNSLVTACNQSSSRQPVTNLAADEVMAALRGLTEKYLVEKVVGGRTAKYEHCLQYVLSLQDNERAVLTVLLLRGAQTAGEIKQRTDRLHTFKSLEEVEETLTWFIEYAHGPLVRRIPVGGGRRVETFEHLLSGRSEESASPEPAEVTPFRPAPVADPTPAPAAPLPVELDSPWRARIEARINELQRQVAELRELISEK